MLGAVFRLSASAVVAAALGGAAAAQPAPTPNSAPAAAPAAPAQPPFATTKVEGTDNVYVFRFGGHQAMFVVTPAGVIATDPISFQRPAAATYLAEIRKITPQPVKYVVYSHTHYDHATGGQPFKDQGATFVAARTAKARLERVKNPNVVMPDQWVDTRTNLSLGGTTVELNYVGRNHSDNSLVMRLPKEKLIFAVDWIPVGAAPGAAGMGEIYPVEYQDGLRKVLALDWDRMIPGHPGPGGRLGTKADVSNLVAYMDDLHAETKTLAEGGKCNAAGFEAASLGSKYAWAAPAAVTANLTRYCLYWTQGY